MSIQSRVRAHTSAGQVAHMAGSLALCIVIAATSACGDQYNSIFRTERLDGPSGGLSLITDAKQRVVLNVDDYRPGRDKGHRIICAEPSPDVAQATSTALQVSANLANTAGASKTDAAAGLALATAAQVAQLGERLATIQAIRERMYRACEAYANGATNSAQYRNMLATIDRLIATTLSVEMAAGAFGRAPVIIGTQAGAGTDPAKMKDLTDKFNAAMAAVEKAKDDEKEQAKQLAIAKDIALQIAGAVGVFAGSGAAQGGGALSGTRPSDAAAVTAIHRNYLDDERIESLVDACVTTLSDVRYTEADYKHYLKSLADERQKIWARYTREPTLAEAISGRDPNAALAAERRAALDAFDRGSRLTLEEFSAQRNKFGDYCLDSVFGRVPAAQTTGRTPAPNVAGAIPPIAPYIIHRMRAKENLRRISDAQLLASLCIPTIARSKANPGDADLKVQANYCLMTMKP